MSCYCRSTNKKEYPHIHKGNHHWRLVKKGFSAKILTFMQQPPLLLQALQPLLNIRGRSQEWVDLPIDVNQVRSAASEIHPSVFRGGPGYYTWKISPAICTREPQDLICVTWCQRCQVWIRSSHVVLWRSFLSRESAASTLLQPPPVTPYLQWENTKINLKWVLIIL